MSVQTETVRQVGKLSRRLTSLERRESGSSGRLSAVFSAYLALPGLRGFWPMSAHNGSLGAIDMAGNALHLTRSGGAFGADGLAPYYDVAGGNRQYHADAAIFDIVGDESGILASYQGLTMGIWIKPDGVDTSATEDYIIGKADDASDNSYWISQTDDDVSFQATELGTPPEAIVTQSAALTAGQWTFLCGRCVLSTEIVLYVNGTKGSSVASIPSQILTGNSNFSLGTDSGGTNPYSGLYSMAFLCAAAVPDATIEELYQVSRGLFGV